MVISLIVKVWPYNRTAASFFPLTFSYRRLLSPSSSNCYYYCCCLELDQFSLINQRLLSTVYVLPSFYSRARSVSLSLSCLHCSRLLMSCLVLSTRESQTDDKTFVISRLLPSFCLSLLHSVLCLHYLLIFSTAFDFLYLSITYVLFLFSHWALQHQFSFTISFLPFGVDTSTKWLLSSISSTGPFLLVCPCLSTLCPAACGQ